MRKVVEESEYDTIITNKLLRMKTEKIEYAPMMENSFLTFSETRWMLRTGNGFKHNSAPEGVGDESARRAGHSAEKLCVCTESWVAPREQSLVPSRTGDFLFFIKNKGVPTMIDIAFIRENPDVVKKASADKLMPVDVDKLLDLDAFLRRAASKADALRAERNRISKLIPACGDEKEREILTGQVRSLKSELSELENIIKNSRVEFDNLMLRVPSVPAPEVPIGKGEDDNVELRRIGQIREFNFKFRDHIELCEIHDMIDMPRGAKIAGSRSYF